MNSPKPVVSAEGDQVDAESTCGEINAAHNPKADFMDTARDLEEGNY